MNSKTLTFFRLIIFILIINLFFTSSAFADNVTSLTAIDSPTQVKPGTYLPIYITVYHIGDFQNISLSSEAEISILAKSVEAKSQNDTITIDSIEIFDPVPKNANPLAESHLKTAVYPNARLNSIGGALEAGKKIESLYLTKKMNKTSSELYGYEQYFKNIIKKGKYHNTTLLKFSEDFPEGDIEVPVKITYTREKNDLRTQESVYKTLSVTVTSTIQPRRAIIIDIDGLKRDALENALPFMPFTKMYITDNGIQFTNANTVFPSITLATQASIFTGNYPKNHSIAGNEWFNRSTKDYRKYDARTWYDIELWNGGWANEDLNTTISTIYEGVSRTFPHEEDYIYNNIIIFNQYWRDTVGKSAAPMSDLELGPTAETLEVLPGRAEGCYMGKVDVCFPEEFENFARFDQTSMTRALDVLNLHPIGGMLGLGNVDGFPKILTIYMTGLDGYSHKYGPATQENYLKTYIDPEIKRLLQGDADHNGIMDISGDVTSLYDETIIVIVADHGQSSVVNDYAHAISKGELESDLTAAGYDIKDNVAESDYDAVAAPNGGMAQIYIRDRDTLEWNDPPELLGDLRPASDAFYSKPYVDIILVRYATSGGYRVYTGNGNTQDLETFFAGKPDYVDSVDRIKGLDSNRSGDIVLLANYNQGYYFVNGDDEAMAGEHGSLNQDDSYIPLVFSGPTIRKGVVDSTTHARNIDMAKTLAYLMAFDMSKADGKELPVQDIIAPTITGNTPTGGDVPVNTQITVTFSEAMNQASVNSAFSISPAISGNPSWNGNTLTYTPSSNLAYTTTYTVTVVPDAKDLAGNSLQSPFTWQFTTSSLPDTSYPTVTGSAPAAFDVPVNTPITVTFSEAMDQESVKLAFSTTPSTTGSFSWNGNIMTYTPGSNLAYNTQYTASVGTSAKDLAGNNLQSPYSWQFTTAATTVPQFCVDSAVDLSTNPDISYYLETAVNSPKCANNWHVKDYDGDGYNEYYLLVGETYYHWASGKAPSLAGHTIKDFGDGLGASYGCTRDYSNDPSLSISYCGDIVEYSWQSKPLTSASSRISSFPMYVFGQDNLGYFKGWGWGSSDLSWNTNGHIEYAHVKDIDPTFIISASPWSQAVVAGSSTTYTVSLTSQGGFSAPVTLTCSGLPSGDSCAFSSNPATPTTTSTLTLSTSSTTPGGTYTITITGTGGGDTKTTTVNLDITAPPNNPPYQPYNPSPINGTSNQLINPTLSWSGGDTDGDPVTYTVYLDTNSNPTAQVCSGTLTSCSVSGLNYSTTYHWKVAASDGKASPVSSNVWRFTTQAQPDLTPPTIISNTPAGSNVQVNTQITVNFSERMNLSSARSAFSTSPATTGSFSWSGNNMTYTPTSYLNYSTTYTVTVGTDVKDLAGNGLPSLFSWQFTTESAADTTQPAGMIGYWSFDGDANDRSGNSNHGIINGATFVQGISGQALSFDGMDDYVDVTTNFGYTTFTISAWIYINEYQEYGGIVDGYQDKWELAMDSPSGNKLEFIQWVPSGYNVYKTQTIPLGTWKYVAVVIKEKSGILYVDGVQDSSFVMTDNVFTGVTSLKIGASISGAPQYFNGLIDEVRIYNRTLSAEEIRQNYARFALSNAGGDTWQYSRDLTITNPGDDLTGYQMLVNLTGISFPIEANTSGADIRFTDANGSELAYWIENWDLTKRSGQVWVNVTNIPAGASMLRMWYGNPNGTSSSNGDMTFDFFDDFEGASLNTTEWVVNSSSYSVSDSILRINTGGIRTNSLPFNLNSGYILEGKIIYYNVINYYSGTLAGMGPGTYTAPGNSNMDATVLWTRNWNTNNSFAAIGDGSTASYNIAPDVFVFTSSDNIWYILGEKFHSNGVILTRNYKDLLSYTFSWVKNPIRITLGVYHGWDWDIQDTGYNWIRIRKYASSEPYIISLSNAGGDAWQYSRDLTITNPGDGLTDYQVLFNLTDIAFPIEANTSGADIRFTDANGSELAYWIENWDFVNRSGQVWVNVTNLPAGVSTLSMWYGNPNATSSSNGNATFEFFDDFNDGMIDTNKWTVQGNPTEISGNLVVPRSTSTYVNSVNISELPFTVEAYTKKSNFGSNSADSSGINIWENATADSDGIHLAGYYEGDGRPCKYPVPRSDTYDEGVWTGEGHWATGDLCFTGKSVVDGNFHRYTFKVTGSSQQVYFDDASVTHPTPFNTVNNYFIYFWSYSPAYGSDMYTDWIFVHKYASPEPYIPGYMNGTIQNNGTGIEGAIVTTNTGNSTKTDASGFYSLLLPSGEYHLTAISEPEFYVNNSITANAVAGSTTIQDIELLKKPTGNISGSVSGK